MAKDEPPIEAWARAAAEAAKKLIPQEAWEAARRVGAVRDQLVDGVTETVRRVNQQVGDMVSTITRPVVEIVDVFRSPEIQDLIKRAQDAFARLPDLTRGILETLGNNGWYPTTK